MNTLAFLQGIFYGLGIFQISPFTTLENVAMCDSIANQITLILNSEMKFTFAINRGICPVLGCIATTNDNSYESQFDIMASWVSPEIAKYLELESYSEGRYNLDKIIEVIDAFGGINYQKSWEYCMQFYKRK